MLSAATSAATVLALVALAAATWWAIDAMNQANERVTETREVLARVVDLREALSEQAFAEAGYRRAPSDQAWERLEEAMAAVPELAADVSAVVSRSERAAISHLKVLNARYVAQVRATRDQPARDGDDRVAGPALDAMNELSGAMADRHRTTVAAATRDQAGLIGTMKVILPGTFLIAFSLLGWAWRLGQRDRRRLRAEAAQDRIRALTDALTGLSNRAALVETMTVAQSQPGCSAALLLLDLDRFKPVNDTWGHQAGDAVLQQVADRLRAAVRRGDTTARLGGDEFAVFLEDAADAPLIAERILASFVEPFDADGHPVDVGTSIGIADSAGHPDPAALLRAADEALYCAKRTGRGHAEVYALPVEQLEPVPGR